MKGLPVDPSTVTPWKYGLATAETMSPMVWSWNTRVCCERVIACEAS
jgi:hypothetical protein